MVKKGTKRLIVFLLPPKKTINGGILSIYSICQVSRQFESTHHAKVILATYPGYKSYGHNDLFENQESIKSFREIVEAGPYDFLMLHIPEYASNEVFDNLQKYNDFLQSVPDLRINIMNQNILMMPKPTDIARWFELTPRVTQTTAHDKYSTADFANKYGLPTHHLSTFVHEGLYKKLSFDEKEDLIVVSPDEHPKRKAILLLLEREYPDFRFVTIKNMRYETYKDLMAKAKFAITFGEGFDGYFVEGFFSHGVTFAVYNDDFFPSAEFKSLANVFRTYTEMQENIALKIKELQDRESYMRLVDANLVIINRFYNFKTYMGKVGDFYKDKLSVLPESAAFPPIIGNILVEKNKRIEELEKQLTAKHNEVLEVGKEVLDRTRELHAKHDELQDVLNSKSWKITKPLRDISAIRKPKA